GCENGVDIAVLVQFLKHRLFYVQVLRYRLNHEIDIRKRFVVDDSLNQRSLIVSLVLCQALLDPRRQESINTVKPGFHGIVIDVLENDRKPAGGHGYRNGCAHCPGTYDCDLTDLHMQHSTSWLQEPQLIVRAC